MTMLLVIAGIACLCGLIASALALVVAEAGRSSGIVQRRDDR
jgi:hypothetical protein